MAFPWEYEGTGEAIGDALVEVLRSTPRFPSSNGSAPSLSWSARPSRGSATTARPPGADGGGDRDQRQDDLDPPARPDGRGGRPAGRVEQHRRDLRQGRCIEPGDWSGPGGARMVLSEPGVAFAVIETARGGLMLRGMGCHAVDVHLHQRQPGPPRPPGLDTVEALAWAKSTVVRVVRPAGGRSSMPRIAWSASTTTPGPGARGSSPSTRRGRGPAFARALGAPLTTWWTGTWWCGGPPPTAVDLGAVVDMPVTIAGLSRENTRQRDGGGQRRARCGPTGRAVIAGLRAFTPDVTSSPGRMNIWSVPTVDGGSATVILDFAHNEAGTEALLRVGPWAAPSGQLPSTSRSATRGPHRPGHRRGGSPGRRGRRHGRAGGQGRLSARAHPGGASTPCSVRASGPPARSRSRRRPTSPPACARCWPGPGRRVLR